MESKNVTMKKPNKITKKFLIKLAVLFFCSGLLLCLIVFFCTGLNIYAISTEQFEKKVYEDSYPYQSYEILAEDDDIEFKASTDDKLHIEYYDSNLVKHNLLKDQEKEMTLTVSASNQKKWYHYIGANYAPTPKITVYLPKKEYKKIYVAITNGNITIDQSLTVTDLLYLETTNGNIRLKDANVKNQLEAGTMNGNITIDGCKAVSDLSLHTTNGNITAKNSICQGTANTYDSNYFSLNTTNGSIILDKCDGANISASTVNGSITGKLISEKRYSCSTVNGSVSVPGPPLGYVDADGMCLLTTVNGNIDMS